MTQAAPAPLTQRDLWNGPTGETWVRKQAQLDAMLDPMTAPTIAALGDITGRKIVDIGCGAGTTTFGLEQVVGPDGAAFGVDISAPLITYAQERARQMKSNARFAVADAGADALEGAPHDALFSRFGVMFFEEPVAALSHMRSMLRPSGAMAFVCWRGIEENRWNALPGDAILPLLPHKPPAPDPNAPGPVAFANPQRTRGLLVRAGWKDVMIEPWDGEIIIAPTVDDAADFGVNMSSATRLIASANIDRGEAVRLITEKLAPLVSADGSVRAQAACWIVTARA
jgi:SAM-dependent methyltransferase